VREEGNAFAWLAYGLRQHSWRMHRAANAQRRGGGVAEMVGLEDPAADGLADEATPEQQVQRAELRAALAALDVDEALWLPAAHGTHANVAARKAAAYRRAVSRRGLQLRLAPHR